MFEMVYQGLSCDLAYRLAKYVRLCIVEKHQLTKDKIHANHSGISP